MPSTAGETIVCTFTNTKDAIGRRSTRTSSPSDASFDFDGTGTGITADIDLS